VSALPPNLFAPSGEDLEAAVHRGRADEAAEHEKFIIERGRPEEVAWLLDVYEQLRVSPNLRLVGERDFRARALARWPDCEPDEVRVFCRLHREQHLAHVRANAESGRIGPGWGVFPSDPPPRSSYEAAA
jgi:hypothetical protein